MSPAPPFPALYQINTRVWLGQLAVQAGRPIGRAEVPDEGLDALAALGFDWVWLHSVWERGAAGRAISRSSEETDRVLEAHLVGPHADQVQYLVALAIRHGLTTEQLKSTIFAYPTVPPTSARCCERSQARAAPNAAEGAQGGDPPSLPVSQQCLRCSCAREDCLLQ